MGNAAWRRHVRQVGRIPKVVQQLSRLAGNLLNTGSVCIRLPNKAACPWAEACNKYGAHFGAVPRNCPAHVLLAKSVWACSPKGGYTVTLSQRSYCKKTKLSRPFSNRPGGLCFYRPRLVRADSDCLSIFPANPFGMSGQGRQAFDPASPSPAAAVSSWRGQEARRGLRLRRRFFRRGRR